MAAGIQVSAFNANAQDCKNSMHFLPCKIAHSGYAKVSEYFESSSQSSNQDCFSDGEVKSASFRGRPLQGKQLNIPSQYEGIVLKEERRPVSEEEERKLVPKTKFNSFFYWNLDSKPTDNDDISKALQWLEMANMLHSNARGINQEETLESTQTDR